MGRQDNTGASGSRTKGSRGGQPQRNSGRPPLSPVYRRRRLLVGILVVLVLAAAVGAFAAVSGAVNGAGQPGDATAGNSQPGTAGTAAGSAAPTPTSAAASCDQGRVTVTAATDQVAYGPEENPMLSLTVTNGNKVPCEVNMGTSQMEFLIISGSDRIFSSRDCQADSTDLLKTIAPGKTETANFPWPRNRSVPGCVAIEAIPGAGGAYYVFTARLGNTVSPKAVFQLN